MVERQPVAPAPTPIRRTRGNSICASADATSRRDFATIWRRCSCRRSRVPAAAGEDVHRPGQRRADRRRAGAALRWFLPESTWDAVAVNARRLELLRAEPLAARVGKQDMGNLGKRS